MKIWCKCEHWEICPKCMPKLFDANGNRLPPEPTPLQACEAQVKALTAALFQAQEAAKALANRQPLTENEIEKLADSRLFTMTGGWREFARAIERAHGIGGGE